MTMGNKRKITISLSKEAFNILKMDRKLHKEVFNENLSYSEILNRKLKNKHTNE